jgi:hypothetical protein
MATIYRFIVESTGQAQTQNLLANNSVDANGVIIPKKGAGSKGGGSLVAHNPTGKRGGGVDHNRFMRPINPLLNRATGGYWEKGSRLVRGGIQLSRELDTIGVKALAGTASLILLQLAIMEIDKYIREQKKKAKEENQSNYLKIISGQTTIGTDYKVSRNIFGKITYRNQ